MNKKKTLFLLYGIVLLLSFVLIVNGTIVNSLRGNRNTVTASSSRNNPASTPVDFFSQEFSSSADIVPVNGLAVGGLGDALLKSNVWNTLLDYERKENCADVTSEAIGVAQINEAGEFWVENWTVNACGKTEVFKIKFTPDPIGGTIYSFVP